MRKLVLFLSVALTTLALTAAGAMADPNDGSVDAVQGDDPSEVLDKVKDIAFEWTPIVLAVLGGVFGFFLAIILIRMIVRRAMGSLTSLGSGR
jgi:hypothetical protein